MELMVVMVIVGILATSVVFMFADPTAKVKAAAFEMRGDFNLARAEAVRRNENILVDFVFSACNKADVDDTANPCAAVCGKVDKAGFDACYSGTGSNQGYVICFNEDLDGVVDTNLIDDDCSDEVSVATPAEDLEEKVIKTVLFKDAVQYYEFSGTLPSSYSGGNVPSKSPDDVDLQINDGITFSGTTDGNPNDFIYMTPNGTSSDEGSVVIYLSVEGSDLIVRGNPYAVVVDSRSTGRVILERWRPEMGASGTWFRR